MGVRRNILAIDPGTTQSAYCVLQPDYSIIAAAKVPNDDLHALIARGGMDEMVIECMEPRFLGGQKTAGQMIGAETYETCIWNGRYMEQAMQLGMPVHRVYRSEERSRLIPSKRNKLPPLPAGAGQTADAQIRASLIQRFAKHDKKNGKGTTKCRDTFYGFAKDMWNAFAVGVVYLDRERNEALKTALNG